MIRVVFVCTGNVCRSPLAEGLLNSRIIEAGRAADIEVDSAGIHALVGEPPQPLSIELAQELGADISLLKARQFDPEDFDKFDHLIAMDLGHLDFLNATRPTENKSDIRLLLDDVGDFKRLEVPDPFRGDRSEYEFSSRLINIGVEHLIKRIGG
jgi:protein-tyrosine phosphatase